MKEDAAMAELVKLILELSSSVIEIPSIFITGICILNSFNFLIGGIVIIPGALARVNNLIHVTTGQITSIFPVAAYFNPTLYIPKFPEVVLHPCDLVRQVALVPGVMLQQDSAVYQTIPNAFNSKSRNTLTTRTIRSP